VGDGIGAGDGDGELGPGEGALEPDGVPLRPGDDVSGFEVVVWAGVRKDPGDRRDEEPACPANPCRPWWWPLRPARSVVGGEVSVVGFWI
jgi:hypothetical protein